MVVVRVTGGTDAVAQDDPGPVLLVSGYGGSTRSLEPLRSALSGPAGTSSSCRRSGTAPATWTSRPTPWAGGADAAMDRFGAASVDVVGYSAGGVVARRVGQATTTATQRPAGW